MLSTALVEDISTWRDGRRVPAGSNGLQPIAALPAKFAAYRRALSRLSIVEEATDRLDELGAQKTASRFLYSATNPIGEECFRECHFSIGEELINEVARGSRALDRSLARQLCLRRQSRRCRITGASSANAAAGKSRTVARFSAALRGDAKMALTGPGLVVLAHLAFQEVKKSISRDFQVNAPPWPSAN